MFDKKSTLVMVVVGLFTNISLLAFIAVLVGSLLNIISFQLWHLVFLVGAVVGYVAIVYLQMNMMEGFFNNTGFDDDFGP